MVKEWLRALWAETIYSIWWILSALSTISTYFVHGVSGRFRIAAGFSTIVGFAWANCRVFKKQETRILACDNKIAFLESRTSELKITDDGGSRYVLKPVGNVRRADFNGIFLEFHLMIENTGRRNSTIDKYEIEIVELRQRFPNLRPREDLRVQGRHHQYQLLADSVLSGAGMTRVDAESVTDRGTLLFFIPDIGLEQFTEAGLHMNGEQRKFGLLTCRLTLIDTTQSAATQEFQLHEE